MTTYIKNRGRTQLYIQQGNNSELDELEWDGDYDGTKANVGLNIKKNGIQKHYSFELDNDALAEILNIPSFKMPIEERLVRDFPMPQPLIMPLRPRKSIKRHQDQGKKTTTPQNKMPKTVRIHFKPKHKRTRRKKPKPNSIFGDIL